VHLDRLAADGLGPLPLQQILALRFGHGSILPRGPLAISTGSR
jgi:hypothetical protein